MSWFAHMELTKLSLREAEEVVQDYLNCTLTEFWRKHIGRAPHTRKEILSVKREMKQYILTYPHLDK